MSLRLVAGILLAGAFIPFAKANAESHAAGSGYVRVAGGMGWISSWQTAEDPERGTIRFTRKLRGLDLNAAAGVLVARNFALHASALGWVAPYEEVGGNYRLLALGGGLTRFGFPGGLYVSGSVGRGRTILGDNRARSDPGLVLDGSIGRDWSDSGNVAWGVLASLGYHRVDSSPRYPARGTSLGLKLSASWN